MDKSAPKLSVYLDQNAWIYLARAYYGKPNSNQYLQALQAVERAVEKGIAVLPLSAVHVIETSACREKERRDRLSLFMARFSCGYSILPFTQVQSREVLQAISKHFKCGVNSDLKDLVIRKGLVSAFGVRISFADTFQEEQALRNQLDSEEVVGKMLSEGIDEENSQRFIQEDQQIAEALQLNRRQVGSASGPMICHSPNDLIHEPLIGPILRQHLNNFQLSEQKFFESFQSPEQLQTFLREIRTYNAFMTLAFEANKQAHRKIHRNDIKDLGALCMAVSYCDIVVTENFFGHLAVSSGLAKKCGCTVLKNVFDLPKYLGA